MLKRIIGALTIPRMVFLIIFILISFFLQLRDPDYFWHLKTGEYLFSTGTFPDGDIFSHTMRGEPWVLHEWLFQILLYLISTHFGDWGIKLTTAALALTPLYILHLASLKLATHRFFPILLVIISLVLIAPYISPRPQLITFLFFSIFLYLLIRFKYNNLSLRGLYLMPVLIIPWANFHGGYFSGIVLLFLFAASELLEYLWSTEKGEGQRQKVLQLFSLTLLTFICSAINPYFIEQWLYPFDVLSMGTVIAIISEWQSPNFHNLLPKAFLLVFILYFLLNIYRTTLPNPAEIIVPLFFATSAFVAARHIPLAIFTFIPFTVKALCYFPTEKLQGNWQKIRHRYFAGRAGVARKELGDKEYLLNWSVLTIIIIAMLLIYPSYQNNNRERINQVVPLYATEFIHSTGLKGRMFNTYHFGGFLIDQLYPDQLVFIDGRADMYGDNFLSEYMKIEEGKPGWEAAFDAHQIDYVVCARSNALRQLLMQRGDFVLVYDDDVNSVLVKDIPRYEQIIQNYRINY